MRRETKKALTPLLILLLAGVTTAQTTSGPQSAAGRSMSNKTSSDVVSVSATIETEPMPVAGDAADDPAIWVNPTNPSRSAVIGTNKKGGLYVYDLNGRILDDVRDGMMNNVDLRDGFPLAGKDVVLVTAGNRTGNTIAMYTLDPVSRTLVNVAESAVKTAPAYGSCMYHSRKTGKFYYILANKAGQIEQWELADNGNGKVRATKVRSLKLAGQAEGCATDDTLGVLYVGEELKGFWKFDAEPDGTAAPVLVDTVDGGRLVADVEGIAIAETGPRTGYLIVSSQGNNSYVVYRREGNNEHVKTFRVVDGQGIDGTADTDGIEVTTRPLGPNFPAGLFVAQDGFNDAGNQNFKLVPLDRILADR